MIEEVGKRYNDGKLRYDLIDPQAQEGLVKVLSFGAEKYEDNNWKKGMDWSTVIASLKRHLAAIEMGEDSDSESGELHIDHLQCNAHFLSYYYRNHPKHDDRYKIEKKHRKIALDIDEVIGGFVKAFHSRFPTINPDPKHWSYSYSITEKLDSLKYDKEFWINEVKPVEDIQFEPVGYVTARDINPEWVSTWIEMNNYPTKPVRVVGSSMSKVEAIKELGADTFVDDSYANWEQITEAGIDCFLMDKPWNRFYDVGIKRIKSLSELRRL